LEDYQWPGNVREMQNVVERAMILSTSSVLTLDAGFQVAAISETPVFHEAQSPILSSKSASLDEVAKTHIMSVLAQTDGVVEGPAGAAKILGLHPNTLRSRMQKLGITRRTS
jgi:formate hydrogenlyase transcriptional activator